MDHFENVIRLLLEADGFWVLSSFKVNLTKEEKRATGKHSIPRPEIDLVAYRPADGFVTAIEVKSFFDSTGVPFKELSETHDTATGRYKLFTSEKYREIVFRRMQLDLVERGFLSKPTPVRLGLAAGNVKNGDYEAIASLANEKGWFYWSPDTVKKKVIDLSKSGYENEAMYICAKILLR